jgi:general secretion pathway protein G
MKTDCDTRKKHDTPKKVSHRKRWPALIIWPALGITIIVFILAMIPYKQNQAGMQSINAAIQDIKNILVKLFIPKAPEGSQGLIRVRMKSIESAIETYLVNTNQFPSTLNDLILNPGIPGWTGPYLKQSQLLDPWDRPFIYKITAEGYELISYGADGKPGGEGYDKDISNKSQERNKNEIRYK